MGLEPNFANCLIKYALFDPQLVQFPTLLEA